VSDRAIVDPAIEAYLEGLLPPADAVQAEMERVARAQGFPIVGPLVGRLLEQLALLSRAERVFEMGSGFGYSTLFFARAVGPGGEVVHPDLDSARSAAARDYLSRAGLADRVRFEVGDALELLSREASPLDIVFIDVEKADYPAALELARPRVRAGGLILTDNALWYGRVTAEPSEHDAATRGVAAYHRAAAAAPELFTTVLPLRDGLAVHYKKAD
jgi:caffeoyl-CoA O-methyltransferase